MVSQNFFTKIPQRPCFDGYFVLKKDKDGKWFWLQYGTRCCSFFEPIYGCHAEIPEQCPEGVLQQIVVKMARKKRRKKGREKKPRDKG